MATTTRVTIGWEHEGAAYRVSGTFWPGRDGRGPRGDDPGSPPEGGEFDIDEVREDQAGGASRPELVRVAQQDLGLQDDVEEELVGEPEPLHDTRQEARGER